MPKSTAKTGGVTAPAITPTSTTTPGARGWRDYALLLALACCWSSTEEFHKTFQIAHRDQG